MPQFHVVYDDLFSTVTCTVDYPLSSLRSFRYENFLDHDDPVPPLASEWLSPEDVSDNQRKSCSSQGCGTLQVSEGDGVPMPVPVPVGVPGPVPVEIFENYPEPNEVSSPERAESDEEPQIAPTTLEDKTVEGITMTRRDEEPQVAPNGFRRKDH